MKLKSYQENELISCLGQELVDRAKSSLLKFTLWTKDDYEVNWHHKVLCHYLDKFANREITRLMVFMPPRTGKSELVSRRLPAFLLGRNPDERIIATSYASDFANRLNRDVQRIATSEKFKLLFPETQLAREEDTNGEGQWARRNNYFEIVGHRGFYRSAGVGGGITGMGADTIIVDDPIKNQQEADSPTYRDRLWDWWSAVLYTRLEKHGRVLITLTRWHEDDLAGRLIKLSESDQGSDQWTIIKFPMVKE